MKKLLALKAKRADLIDRQAKIVDAAVDQTRALSAEENAELGTIQTEVEGLDKTIETAEKVEARQQKLDDPDADPWRPSNVIPGERGRNNALQDDGGFKNLGEMLHAVKNGDPKSRLRELEAENGYRLPEAFATLTLGHGEEGFQNFSTGDAGVLIPPTFSGNVFSLQEEPELVAPRTTFIPAGDPPDGEFVVPYFDQGANGANGGVSIFWTAEAQLVPDTKEPVIKDLTLKPQEASGLATVNNKTLQNWKAAGAFLQGVMTQAWKNGRDMKFLAGSGAGAPLGTLAAGNKAAIRIARTTAGTVVLNDVANMMARLMPEAMPGAVWIANITLLPALVTMKSDMGELVYMPGNVTGGIPATLFGIPVQWTGKTPVKGFEGDLSLQNFRYYLMKPGSGPFVAISEHVKFKTNQTVFRIVANVDGQPWVKEPLLLQDGKTTVSPFVILK